MKRLLATTLIALCSTTALAGPNGIPSYVTLHDFYKTLNNEPYPEIILRIDTIIRLDAGLYRWDQADPGTEYCVLTTSEQLYYNGTYQYKEYRVTENCPEVLALIDQ